MRASASQDHPRHVDAFAASLVRRGVAPGTGFGLVAVSLLVTAFLGARFVEIDVSP